LPPLPLTPKGRQLGGVRGGGGGRVRGKLPFPKNPKGRVRGVALGRGGLLEKG